MNEKTFSRILQEKLNQNHANASLPNVKFSFSEKATKMCAIFLMDKNFLHDATSKNIP
jgi:hypothetical protein